jgi:hypothetical protein
MMGSRSELQKINKNSADTLTSFGSERTCTTFHFLFAHFSFLSFDFI